MLTSKQVVMGKTFWRCGLHGNVIAPQKLVLFDVFLAQRGESSRRET